MRVLVQRVCSARVTVDGHEVGAIGPGLVLLVGIGRGDGPDEVAWIAKRVAGLRIFENDEGRMAHAVADVGGAVLAVPQFTLYGDCRRGRRPDFTAAALPDDAAPLFEAFCAHLRAAGLAVATGAFREHMHVELINDGPVTIWVEREPPGAFTDSLEQR
jgi:D-tyrosyl-tRNA(Tyr) deacylase